MHFLYLLINLFTISIPLLRSFEPKINFSSNFKGLFSGIAIVGLIFIVWDVIFTKIGVWGFNPDYLSGFYILNLPIEECLFFITVPFSCMFIYEVLNYFIKPDPLYKIQKHVSIILAMALLILAIIYHEKWYPFLTFLFTGSFLLFLVLIAKVSWLGKFYRAFLVILIPFFIVNGILTGTGIANEIVWYNDDENLGIRILTIPIEDSIYGMLLVLGNTYFFEKFRKYP